MAEEQAYAWVLALGAPINLTIATMDLWEPPAVTAFGAPVSGRIRRVESALEIGLTSSISALARISGIVTPANVTLIVENDDGAIDATDELRLAPAVLSHYDRNTGTATVELSGIIVEARFEGTQAVLTIGAHNAALMQELLPFAVIDPKPGSPFAASASPGVPPPVVFGSLVPIRPPSASRTASTSRPARATSTCWATGLLTCTGPTLTWIRCARGWNGWGDSSALPDRRLMSARRGSASPATKPCGSIRRTSTAAAR